jgi:hypothetical protein
MPHDENGHKINGGTFLAVGRVHGEEHEAPSLALQACMLQVVRTF